MQATFIQRCNDIIDIPWQQLLYCIFIRHIIWLDVALGPCKMIYIYMYTDSIQCIYIYIYDSIHASSGCACVTLLKCIQGDWLQQWPNGNFVESGQGKSAQCVWAVRDPNPFMSFRWEKPKLPNPIFNYHGVFEAIRWKKYPNDQCRHHTRHWIIGM